KGVKISGDHYNYWDSFVTNGCEVYVFNDYDMDIPEISYVAYIIDGNKSPFYDIREDHWAREYIDTCFEAGIMNGTGGGKFSPSGAVSRAQVVTTLWRLAGEPEANGASGMTFTDVADGQWYTEAVAWAAENGITAGVGGSSFAPDRTVTRGEVAAILYRYASYAGEDVSGRADLNTFADTGALSDWNRDAFAWCVDGGIIGGKTTGELQPVYLAPSDTLTRAELAAVLYRYGI
ncbi:MAG: S-layer homology domain-containing protein, partial [Clostridia bacterium]|nr:S-layer homology domain-containing protein [Clostridia bacterium]